MITPAASPSQAPVLALLEHDRLTRFPHDRPLHRKGPDGRLWRLAQRDDAVHVVSGEASTRVERALQAGDVVHIGRRPLLIVRSGVSRRFPDAFRWQGFLASSPAMCRALNRVAAAAPSDAPVWLHGESGTGKELAARALHAASARAHQPFVALNCAAIPETLAEAELFGALRGAFTGADRDRPGAFASADGGTLFLDEIAELPRSTQATLLRSLESGVVQPLGGGRPRAVDVRVVVATWRDLEDLAAAGAFRFDLLQRLAVLRISLPSLRDRPTDIGPLVEAFLSAQNALDLWPDPAQLDEMMRCPWMGNVRELHNAVQRAAVWGDRRELVSRRPRRRVARFNALRSHRRLDCSDRQRSTTVHDVLRLARGNRTEAARIMGISRSTLYRWLRSHEGRSFSETGPQDVVRSVDTPLAQSIIGELSEALS